ncbi:helix-loop-helix protein delilah-like isoform X2 [Procambarus clarkii]|uniref:helix-loop-helix protein delilah-like isoform X2 n=1 Tax=Procambarus clarkii TaxID=6728 RepID=UPI001E66FE13|nr:helix-loop-helix protein delilah-like [Procambarus clarkii]
MILTMLPDIPTSTLESALSAHAGRHDQEELVDTNNNDQEHCCHDNDDGNCKNEGDDKSADSRICQTSAGAGVKYQLRPRSGQGQRRYDSDWNLHDTLIHKPRPPPLSRYRRKTANARERYRMRQINSAFESLRGVLPSWVCRRRAAADLTKITTLKLASAYIRSLQDILDGNAHQDICSWVLSSLLQDDPTSKKPRLQLGLSCPSETQLTELSNTPTESQLVSLLYGASATGILEDDLGSFSYSSSVSETEGVSLLLGCDPAPAWTPQYPHVVT